MGGKEIHERISFSVSLFCPAGYLSFLRLNLDRHHLLMRRVLALFILSFLFSAVTAQKPGGNIKGLLLDTTVKQPITDATISVFQADDSSLVTSALSNKEGFFEIK